MNIICHLNASTKTIFISIQEKDNLMAESYGRNWKKYIVWYIIIAIIAYLIVYFVFFRY